MAFTRLHNEFIDFAKGMPAVAVSWRQIARDIELLEKSLAGAYPGAPSPFMANVPMPVYDLAYSAFVRALKIDRKPGAVELIADLLVTVHLMDQPTEIIREYEITAAPSTNLKLEFDGTSNELTWVQSGSTMPRISPKWGANYQAVLGNTTLPAPQDQSFLDEVERQILWLTAPSFIRLVTESLPRYPLHTLAPWLTLIAPARIRYADDHVLVTANRATLTTGVCSPETVVIEPDPLFPYGEAIPAPASASRADLAVYTPKSRLFDLAFQSIKPAVMVSSSGGGIVKWSMAGSAGLARLVVDILSNSGTTGVVRLGAGIDFVAAASAWVDGPCGVRLSMASGSVIGDGNFVADVTIALDPVAWIVDVTLAVIHCDIPNVKFDLNTPLPWPLNAIAGEILAQVSKQEARKLAGKIVHLGRWEVLGLPPSYPDTIAAYDRALAVHEGLAKVSAVFAVTRKSNEG